MKNKRGMSVVYLVSAVSLFTYGSAIAKNVLSDSTDIVVKGSKSDEDDAFCKEFSLNKQQAKDFFSKAQIIDNKIIHDQYEYLPC